MSALGALSGAALENVWLDVPRHRVTMVLRTRDHDTDAVTDHTLVLEDVTDFSFFDETAEAWPHAQITDIQAEHDPDSMRVDFSFGGAAAGITVTCGKIVLRRVHQGN
ncbi:hypothetical protein HDA32_000781 [Spinactinospora alkalitolerans]|uniref:Uncharacterized protein n=1 Tax=Spinactinospora alkalitolerans TaxID=687207 RepID=A0A852TQ64_9ACTN|nr:hypothetical protein [Spinactinospora alkalitolerans]NYE45661.1 hypothetical protein [Spinactinospora alkalitolerans]